MAASMLPATILSYSQPRACAMLHLRRNVARSATIHVHGRRERRGVYALSAAAATDTKRCLSLSYKVPPCICLHAFNVRNFSADAAKEVQDQIRNKLVRNTTNKLLDPKATPLGTFNTELTGATLDAINHWCSSETSLVRSATLAERLLQRLVYEVSSGNLSANAKVCALAGCYEAVMKAWFGVDGRVGAERTEAALYGMADEYFNWRSDTEPSAQNFLSTAEKWLGTGEDDAAEKAASILLYLTEGSLFVDQSHFKEIADLFHTILDTMSQMEDQDSLRIANSLMKRMHELHEEGWDNMEPNDGVRKAVLKTILDTGPSPATVEEAKDDASETGADNSFFVDTIRKQFEETAKHGDMDTVGNVEAMLHRLESLSREGETGYVIDISTYSQMLGFYSRVGPDGAAKKATQVLRKIDKLFQDDVGTGSLGTSAFNQVLRLWAESRRKEAPWRAHEIFNRMCDLGASGSDIRPDTESLNIVLKLWEESDDDEGAGKAQVALKRMIGMHKTADVLDSTTEQSLRNLTGRRLEKGKSKSKAKPLASFGGIATKGTSSLSQEGKTGFVADVKALSPSQSFRDIERTQHEFSVGNTLLLNRKEVKEILSRHIPGVKHFKLGNTKVYIRGLPWRATEEEVRDFFKDCGEGEIELPLQDDGRSSGTAIIDFATEEAAVAALKLYGATFGDTGQWLNIKYLTDKPITKKRNGCLWVNSYPTAKQQLDKIGWKIPHPTRQGEHIAIQPVKEHLHSLASDSEQTQHESDSEQTQHELFIRGAKGLGEGEIKDLLSQNIPGVKHFKLLVHSDGRSRHHGWLWVDSYQKAKQQLDQLGWEIQHPKNKGQRISINPDQLYLRSLAGNHDGHDDEVHEEHQER